MHLLLCQYHAVSISVALQYRLKSDSKIAPAMLFFFIIVLATWGLSCFHTKFKNICPMSVKNVWVYIQRKQNTNLRRSINTNVHSSIIYNSQVMEATLVSINRWMDKEDKVCIYIYVYMHVCAQSHLALYDPMDCSPPASSVHEIFEARILEWVSISYSRVSSWLRDQTHISCISWVGRWIFHLLATWEAPVVYACMCVYICIQTYTQ